MISIQQWRAAICSIGQTKVKQIGENLPNLITETNYDLFQPPKFLTIRRKTLFVSLLSCLTILSIHGYNLHSFFLTIPVLGQHHSSVIRTLGGVEVNPGPQTIAEILGQLIADAQKESTKRTLNKIRTDSEHKDYLIFSRLTRTTAQYVNV